MESDIQTIIALVKSTYGAAAGGTLAVLSAGVYGLVKLLRIPLIQTVLGRISPKLMWSAWPKWVAVAFVFGCTLIGAFLSALALGTAWLPALVGAISVAVPVALGSMGVDAAAGAVLPPKPVIQPLPGSPANP